MVTKLTAKTINDWLVSLANSPARLRTAKGAEQQNVRATADTDEARRRRRSSANRILTILKAALNTAYRNGKAGADDAWRREKPFAKADAPKLRYLSDDEARRLVNACDPAFRPLVQAALLTGTRMALRGVPMAVIAEALGHADERITRRHYAHLSKSYVADTVRNAVAGLGIVEKGNLVRLDVSI